MLTETLKELCALPGVSSCEDAVRDYIRAITAPYADRSYTDTLGNLIIEKKGVSPGTKKVMLAAHMDEVGLMVHTITEDGYLKFRPVGGIDRRVLLGKPVLVGKQKLPGVIGLEAYHLTSGTGLGLSIVKHAAAYHDAKIQLDSQLGRGTRVRVLFPLSQREAQP